MDLYAENILEHYQNPHNFGHIEGSSCHNCDSNPSCGDKICIELALKENVIEDIKFNGSGCAISQASASLLTDYVKGKTVEEAKNVTDKDVYGLLGVPISPGRVKCALLALVILKKALIEVSK